MGHDQFQISAIESHREIRILTCISHKSHFGSLSLSDLCTSYLSSCITITVIILDRHVSQVVQVPLKKTKTNSGFGNVPQR